jgi:SHS2 domain-containing protein
MTARARPTATHSFDEPSDELRLRVEAPSLEELYVEAGRALSELMLPLASHPVGDRERVTVEAIDRDALLVDWINELIFRTETEHRVFVEFQFERLTDRFLSAWVRGVELAETRTPIKAATLHDLHITEHDHGFSVTVTLDV